MCPIIAAREPLPLEILQNNFKWKVEELRDFTKQSISLFPVTGESGSKVIAPVNKSLVNWLTNEAKAGVYFANDKEGHRLLSDIGWKEFQECFRKVRNMNPYFLAYLPSHLRFFQDRIRWHSVMLNFPYLLEKYLRSKKWDSSDFEVLYGLPLEDTPLKFCWQNDFGKLMRLVPRELRYSLTAETIAERLSSVQWEYIASTPYDDVCYLMARSPFDDQYYLWASFTNLSYEPTSIQSHRPPYFEDIEPN